MNVWSTCGDVLLTSSPHHSKCAKWSAEAVAEFESICSIATDILQHYICICNDFKCTSRGLWFDQYERLINISEVSFAISFSVVDSISYFTIGQIVIEGIWLAEELHSVDCR